MAHFVYKKQHSHDIYAFSFMESPAQEKEKKAPLNVQTKKMNVYVIHFFFLLLLFSSLGRTRVAIVV